MKNKKINAARCIAPPPPPVPDPPPPKNLQTPKVDGDPASGWGLNGRYKLDVCLYMCVYIYNFICIYIHIDIACIYVYICMCVLGVCMYIYKICTWTYIYIYTHTYIYGPQVLGLLSRFSWGLACQGLVQRHTYMSLRCSDYRDGVDISMSLN